MRELERTYLARYLPQGIASFQCKEIIDIYIPKGSRHPVLRLRKSGEKYEITKKEPVKEGDASHMNEQTITLTREEFEALKRVHGKIAHKFRYIYPFGPHTAEIDIFQEELEGLVIVDFEFRSLEEKDAFTMPEFCLAEVTQEEALAGGMLCGKSYGEIEPVLKKYGYKKLALDF
jgi:CYTH domain-containing protein